MTARAQSQGGAPSPHRNSISLSPTPAPSQPPLRHSNHWTSGDAWDYNDAGPSITPTNPKQYSGDASSADESADVGRHQRFADELRANILEKAVGGNRAKLPDDSDRANSTLVASNTRSNPQAAASSPSKRGRRRLLRTSHSSITSRVPRSADKTFLLKVGLHWSRESIERVEKVLLTACTPTPQALRGSENSVLWQ